MYTNQSGPICRRNSSFYLMMLKQEPCQNELPRAQTHFITGCFQTFQAEGGQGETQPLLPGVRSVNRFIRLFGPEWRHLVQFSFGHYMSPGRGFEEVDAPEKERRRAEHIQTAFLVGADRGSNPCLTTSWLCDLGQISEPL